MLSKSVQAVSARLGARAGSGAGVPDMAGRSSSHFKSVHNVSTSKRGTLCSGGFGTLFNSRLPWLHLMSGRTFLSVGLVMGSGPAPCSIQHLYRIQTVWI